LEASATAIFGVYFTVALVLAYRTIRRRDVAQHRRWMIRAFAIGLAVGTIRVWIGLFQVLELLSLEESFGIAFWISFILHAIAAELWLHWRPNPDGRPGAERRGRPGPRRAVQS
jgi:uncharacterized membrane protein YozB (DUF420 family)